MRLGSRAKLTIGIGAVAAAGFAALGIRELNNAGSPVASAGPNHPHSLAPTQILLAGSIRAIRTGETITAEMIRGTAADPVENPMIAPPAEAIGKVAMRDIPASTLIPRTALGQGDKLAIRVPQGMRAFSIETNAEIAVAGLLQPGDRVDVQVVYPGADAISGARGTGRSQAQTLLQMVEVLAVGDTVVGASTGVSDDADGASGSGRRSSAPPAVARTVTLALFPEQVAILSLAKSTGTLHLSLRNPSDRAQPHVARVISSGPLPERRAPEPVVAAAVAPSPVREPARAKAKPHAIDLVIGDSHKVIYSGGEAR